MKRFLTIFFIIFGCYIQNATLTEDGRFEVITICPSSNRYTSGEEPPGTAVKDIYKAENGKIILEKSVPGAYYPKRYDEFPSRIEWNKK